MAKRQLVAFPTDNRGHTRCGMRQYLPSLPSPSSMSGCRLTYREISSVQLWVSLWVAGVLSPSSISEGRLIIEMGGWGERAGE